jgi:hypothetical protein
MKLFPEIDFVLVEEKIVTELNRLMCDSVVAAENISKTKEKLCFSALENFLYDDFDSEEDNLVVTTNNLAVLQNYLKETDRLINVLLRSEYSGIKQLFINYNTQVPTSASCERLFSMAKFVLTASRSLLSDQKFEKLLILKCNYKKKLFS